MNFVYRVHALERMFERDINEEDVEKIVTFGEIIENYPEDKPYESYLVLGQINNRAIHVVYAIDENDTKIIITAYEPSIDIWENNFRTRRKPNEMSDL